MVGLGLHGSLCLASAALQRKAYKLALCLEWLKVSHLGEAWQQAMNFVMQLQELRTGKFATQEEAVKALDDLFIANAVHPKHLGKPEDHDVSFSPRPRLFKTKYSYCTTLSAAWNHLLSLRGSSRILNVLLDVIYIESGW